MLSSGILILSSNAMGSINLDHLPPFKLKVPKAILLCAWPSSALNNIKSEG